MNSLLSALTGDEEDSSRQLILGELVFNMLGDLSGGKKVESDEVKTKEIKVSLVLADDGQELSSAVYFGRGKTRFAKLKELDNLLHAKKPVDLVHPQLNAQGVRSVEIRDLDTHSVEGHQLVQVSLILRPIGDKAEIEAQRNPPAPKDGAVAGDTPKGAETKKGQGERAKADTNDFLSKLDGYCKTFLDKVGAGDGS